MRKIVLGFAIVALLASLCAYAGATGHESAAPGAPSALKLVIVPDGFKLSWTPPENQTGVTGYEIVRANLASGPFLTVAKVNKGVSEYVDTTAAPENIYYYKVKAMAGTEESPCSNTVTGER